MALFDRSGRKKRRLPGAQKAWWETAREFSPETIYDPGIDYAPAGPFDPKWVFDPMGSYTGVPDDGGEPEQDADDL